MWLLSKGKTAKAKKVLKKLRGCSTEEKCAVEFHEMIQYVSQSAKSGKFLFLNIHLRYLVSKFTRYK